MENKGPLVFIVLLILGIGGYLALDFISSKKLAASASGDPNATAASGAKPGPKPGDKQLVAGTTPDAVMGAVSAPRKMEDQQAEALQWKGQWLPPEGWSGTIEKMSAPSIGGGTIMKFVVTQPGIAGGYTISAHLDDGQEMYKGSEVRVRDIVTFGGFLEDIVVIAPNGIVPTPTYGLVVRKASMLSVNGK